MDVLVRGLVAFVLAAFAFGSPAATANAHVYFVAAYFIISGVVARPDLGLLAPVYTIGYYAIFAGISLTGFAFRIKNLAGDFAGRRARA